MIEIILDEEVVAADLVNDRNCLLHRIEIKARNIIVIDRLDQQADAMLAQFLCGKPQVADESCA
ncbi:hypothetical protein D3C79_1077920 [compost metagenome]